MSNNDPGWRSRYSDWLRAGRPRVRSSSSGVVMDILFSTLFRPALGVYSASYAMGAWGFSPGVERQGREADHSPSNIAEAKKCGSIHPLPHTPSWLSA
jgi:hypothetical protein